MRKLFHLLFLLLGFIYQSNGQVTTSPQFPKATDYITFTVDVTGTSLENYSNDVWIWTWIEEGCSANCDAPTNVNPATSTQSAALMIKDGSNPNIYSITFTPTSFFNKSVDEFIVLGLLLKGQDWSNGQTPDYKVEISTDQYAVQINQPIISPLFFDSGDVVQIQASSSETSDLTIRINNVIVSTVSNSTSVNYSGTAGTAGKYVVEVSGSNGTESAAKSFCYMVRSMVTEESRPQGIIDGINYGTDLGKVILSLWAPLKSNVYVLGDFNDFQPDPDYFMKKDGEHFWLEITGLTSGQEYAYQYLVDETIWIADPYSDKILDPDDKWIPLTTYPDLLEYPAGATHSQWYENRAAVFQTNQIPYNWKNSFFKKPEKEKLIIYELLVRDFLGEENMNYNSLIDTLGYLQDLGVNAIELMPIMEFSGNDSWGYNPTFMFAVDKAYGTKNDLKAFIDAAHGKGIAVILDMVMNQNDIPSPYAQMYFDFTAFKPTSDNPWFNTNSKHPFNVFSDINHESLYTKAWLDSINHYWINEFQFDGFRFDLSKGFTQTNSGDNVSLWSQKDDSRIAILKRMADAIWSHTPDAYVILEHFADNSEEKILSDYGMMLWGNSVHDYSEANLGFADSKSIGWAYYKTRGWNDNHVVAYMESHDEERQMFKNQLYGNSSEGYDVKVKSTGLDRLKLSAAFFFTVPGPKMLWQFGEFGYDISIEENGRTGRKPTHWEYLKDINNANLLNGYRELIGLRKKYNVFNDGIFTWQPDGNYKSIHISNADTSVTIIGNFDVLPSNMNPEFQHTGLWYDFFSGNEITVVDVNSLISLEPGKFHIYTDKKLHMPVSDLVTGFKESEIEGSFRVFPNPVNNTLNIHLINRQYPNKPIPWTILDVFGKEVLNGNLLNGNLSPIDVKSLSTGIYVLVMPRNQGLDHFKFIKE